MSYKPPQKVIFSTPSTSGVTASISTTSHTVTLTGGSGFTSAMNDGYIIINGANTPLSNGVFQITYISSTSVSWINSHVTSGSDSFNGFIVWAIAQTWIAPPDINYVDLVLIGGGAGGGGGGGGGGGIFHTLGYGGGGGASGSYGTSGQLSIVNNVQVIPGTTYYISVGNNGAGGAGGAGGASATVGTIGSNGTSGTPSQFMFANGLAYFADGGQAGEVDDTYGSGKGGNPGQPGGSFAGGAGGASNGGDGSQAGLNGGGTSSSLQNNAAVTTDTTAGAIYHIYSTSAISPASFTTTSQTNLTETYGLSQGMFGALGPNSINRSGSNTNFSNSAGSGGTYPFVPASATSFAGSSGNAPGGAGGVLDMTGFLPLYIMGANLNTISYDGITFPYMIGGALGNGGYGATPGSTPTSASIGFWSNSIATIFGYGAGGLGGPGGGGGGGAASPAGSAGGAGYQGDQGLSGIVIISW